MGRCAVWHRRRSARRRAARRCIDPVSGRSDRRRHRDQSPRGGSHPLLSPARLQQLVELGAHRRLLTRGDGRIVLSLRRPAGVARTPRDSGSGLYGFTNTIRPSGTGGGRASGGSDDGRRTGVPRSVCGGDPFRSARIAGRSVSRAGPASIHRSNDCRPRIHCAGRHHLRTCPWTRSATRASSPGSPAG